MKKYANGAWQPVWENYYAKFHLDRGTGFNGFTTTLDSNSAFKADGNELVGRIKFASSKKYLLFLVTVPYTRRDMNITYDFDLQGNGRGDSYVLKNFQQLAMAGDITEMKLLNGSKTWEIQNEVRQKGHFIVDYYLGGYVCIGLLFGPRGAAMDNYVGLTVNFQVSNFMWNGKRIGFETDSFQM